MYTLKISVHTSHSQATCTSCLRTRLHSNYECTHILSMVQHTLPWQHVESSAQRWADLTEGVATGHGHGQSLLGEQQEADGTLAGAQPLHHRLHRHLFDDTVGERRRAGLDKCLQWRRRRVCGDYDSLLEYASFFMLGAAPIVYLLRGLFFFQYSKSSLQYVQCSPPRPNIMTS